MSDSLRFTPLYVIQIFLDILYFSNENIVIPEALLESHPSIEENLRQDLRKIDEIADLEAVEQIIKFVTTSKSFMFRFKVACRYDKIFDALHGINEAYSDDLEILEKNGCVNPNDLETFIKHFNNSNILNRDVLRDLLPFRFDIMIGGYAWSVIIDCIFR